MEQHFQGVAQKVHYDKNLESFAAHFIQHFIKKSSPQQCFTITSFRIISTENPLGLMKNWVKFSFTLCMKEKNQNDKQFKI